MIFRPGRTGCGLNIQFDDYVVANQVIGHTRIIDIEIAAVNGEIGLHRHGVICDLYVRGERNTFSDAMKVEITRDLLLSAGGLDTRDGKGRHRIIRHVEEIFTLQVSFKLFVIRPEGLCRDLDLRRADDFPTRDLDLPREICESAIMTPRDFGPDKADLRCRSDRIFFGSGCRRCFRSLRFGRSRFLDFVRRVGTAGDEARSRS